MKLLDRYVLKILIKYTFIVLAFTMIISMVSSALTHLGENRAWDITAKQLAYYEVLTIPLSLTNLIPIAIVVASIATVTTLMRSRELLAYTSLGGRIRRFLAPFIFLALVSSAYMLFASYSLNTDIRLARDRYRNEVIRGHPFHRQDRLVDVWLYDTEGSGRLIHIDYIDPILNTVSGLTEYYMNGNFVIESVQETELASYENKKWIYTGITRSQLGSAPPVTETIESYNITSRLLDDLSSISGVLPKQLSLKELAKVIQVMQDLGLSTTSHQMVYDSIFSRAFSVIILVLLVVPMGINFSRNYSSVKSAIIAFTFGGLFWASLSVGSTLGRADILSVKLANFGPHVIFFIIGLFMIYARERAK